MEFKLWLQDRGIDIQSVEPEIQAALQMQFETDCRRLAPAAEVLIVPSDCQWPARGYWTPVQSSQ